MHSSNGLNKNSNFEDIAQTLLERYYKQPYPNQASTTPGINRFYHGALHAVSAAYATDLVLALIQKYLSKEFSNSLTEYDNDRELQKLIRLGALCHDIGNQQESDTNEQAHADIFTNEMTQLGFDPQKIKTVADAIINKDKNVKDTLVSILIGDADRFEYSRVLSDKKKFRIDYLKLHQYFTKIPDAKQRELAITELTEIVNYYFNMSQVLCRVIGIHKKIENAASCCHEVMNYIKSYRVWVLLGAEFNCIDVVYPAPDLFLLNLDCHIPPLELYNDNKVGVAAQIARGKYLAATGQVSVDEKPEPLKIYDNLNSVYVRRLVSYRNKETPVTDELAIVLKNAEILKRSGLESLEKIRDQLPKELKSDISQVKSEFKFRPASCNVKGIYSYDFNDHAVGFLLSPDKVQSVCFYKANMYSNNITAKDFDFERPSRIKRLKSHQDLVTKIQEMDKRRRGVIIDPNHKYYGRSALGRTETLLNYDDTALIAILIGEPKGTMRQALRIRMQLSFTKRLIPFARSRPFAEIEPISEAAVLAEAGLIPQKPEYKLEFTSRFPRGISLPIKHELGSAKINLVSVAPDNSFKLNLTYPDKKDYHAEAIMLDGVPILKINNEDYLDIGNTFHNAIKISNSNIIDKINPYFFQWDWFFETAFGIQSVKINENIKLDPKTNVEKRTWSLHYRKLPGSQAEPKDILEKLGYKAPIKPGDIKEINDPAESKESSIGSESVEIRLRSIAELTKTLKILLAVIAEMQKPPQNVAWMERSESGKYIIPSSTFTKHPLTSTFFDKEYKQHQKTDTEFLLTRYATAIWLGHLTYIQFTDFISAFPLPSLERFAKHILINKNETYFTPPIQDAIKQMPQALRESLFLHTIQNKCFKMAQALAETRPFSLKNTDTSYLDTLEKEKAWDVIVALVKNEDINYDISDFQKLNQFFDQKNKINKLMCVAGIGLSLFELSAKRLFAIILAQYQLFNEDLLAIFLKKIVVLDSTFIADPRLSSTAWIIIFNKLLKVRLYDVLIHEMLDVNNSGLRYLCSELLSSMLKIKYVSTDLILQVAMTVFINQHISSYDFYKLLTDLQQYAKTHDRKDLLIKFMAEAAESTLGEIMSVDTIDEFNYVDFLACIEDVKLTGEQANSVAKFLLKLIGKDKLDVDWLDRMYTLRVFVAENEKKWNGVIPKEVNEFFIEEFYKKNYSKACLYSLMRSKSYKKETVNLSEGNNPRFLFFKVHSGFESSLLPRVIIKAQLQNLDVLPGLTSEQIAIIRKMTYIIENDGLSLEDKNHNDTLVKYDFLIEKIENLKPTDGLKNYMRSLLGVAVKQFDLGLKFDMQTTLKKMITILNNLKSESDSESDTEILTEAEAHTFAKLIEDRAIAFSSNELATYAGRRKMY